MVRAGVGGDWSICWGELKGHSAVVVVDVEEDSVM